MLDSNPLQSRPDLRSADAPPKFMYGSLVTLNLIMPPSVELQAVTVSSLEEMHDPVQSFKAILRGRGLNGVTQLILRSRHSELSPSEVYEIFSPVFQCCGRGARS
jgi:hypothetical protein